MAGEVKQWRTDWSCPYCGGTGLVGDPRCRAGDHELVLVARAEGVPDAPGDDAIVKEELRAVIGTGGTWKRRYDCTRPGCEAVGYDLYNASPEQEGIEAMLRLPEAKGNRTPIDWGTTASQPTREEET